MNVAVMRPIQPPAWRDFDDLTSLAKALVIWSERLDKLFREHRETTDDFAGLRRHLKQFFAGIDVFEREEFYEQREQPRPDLLGIHTRRQLSRRVVAEQVALLIGSFPSTGPHSPETYTRMLVEEIVAANPHVIPLEATCRKLRRTQTFLPAVAEVLKILRQQAQWWHHAWGEITFLKDYNETTGTEPIPWPKGDVWWISSAFASPQEED